MYVQRLQKKHTQLFRQIRLLALEQVPEAFVASYEEEVNKPDSFFESQLKETNYYGMFNRDERLIGIVSLSQARFLKMRHKASIGSVYVIKEARGMGVAKKLIDHVLETAIDEGIEQVNLVVAANNQSAKKVYESLGFESYGYEKRALKVKGLYIDEEYMMKQLQH